MNLRARVVNGATTADVETVVVDGTELLDEGVPQTMDRQSVETRVERALQRFEAETDWELGVGGSDSPRALDFVRDLDADRYSSRVGSRWSRCETDCPTGPERALQ